MQGVRALTKRSCLLAMSIGEGPDNAADACFSASLSLSV